MCPSIKQTLTRFTREYSLNTGFTTHVIHLQDALWVTHISFVHSSSSQSGKKQIKTEQNFAFESLVFSLHKHTGSFAAEIDTKTGRQAEFNTFILEQSWHSIYLICTGQSDLLYDTDSRKPQCFNIYNILKSFYRPLELQNKADVLA